MHQDSIYNVDNPVGALNVSLFYHGTIQLNPVAQPAVLLDLERSPLERDYAFLRAEVRGHKLLQHNVIGQDDLRLFNVFKPAEYRASWKLGERLVIRSEEGNRISAPEGIC